MKARLLRLPLLLLVLFTALSFFAQTAPPADIDAYVARTMKEFEVPGMAIAIVKDGKVVLAKGYGVRKLGDPAPVDERTLFGIASNTKAFTAASVAVLVDEKKLSWDDRVIKHMPDFRIDDPFITNELTVRDLLSHRSGLGLGQGDLMFWPDTDFTRGQVLASTRYLKPVYSLRSRYAYNNLMFIVASELVSRVSGLKWDDFVRQNIFEPVGMNSTVITAASFKNGGNFAVPHSRGWRLEGKLVPIKGTLDDTWAGAAGVKSNVVDLSKWVALQLNGGKLPDGKEVFSAAAQRQMWSMQIATPISEPAPGLGSTKPQFAGYGLGWALRDYRGHKIVSHGGALTGMLSTVQMIPDQNLGIVVLTNQEESGAFMAVVYHIMDHYLGAPETDWISAYKSAREKMLKKANDAERLEADARAKDSRPSLALAKYAGTYHDNWYGDAVIEAKNGKLELRMTRTPAMVADLEPWQYDTFKAVFRDNTIPDAFVTFWINAAGKIEQVRMSAVNDLADFSFDYQDLSFKPVEK
jgi:CubicO group peptidase (beta-lactamase class C family)